MDKIDELTAELHDGATNDQERLYALQFILHFVGDVHQPLHASDEHDQGGNTEMVTAPGLSWTGGNLHAFWDTQLVTLQGKGKTAIARKLIAQITPAQRTTWSAGSAIDWAKESSASAEVDGYGRLPTPTSPHHYTLPKSYVTNAKAVVAEQLSKAGVRLAFVLNTALQ